LSEIELRTAKKRLQTAGMLSPISYGNSRVMWASTFWAGRSDNSRVGFAHTGKNPRGKPPGFKTIITPSKEAVKSRETGTPHKKSSLKS
jgi:hypothetical protein